MGLGLSIVGYVMALAVLAAPARPAAAERSCLLFVRHNEVNGAAESDTLVLARPGAAGTFELKELYTLNNLHVGFHPLGAFGGKVYFLHVGSVLCLDTANGRCTRVAANVRSGSYRDLHYYRWADGEIHDCDLRLGAFRRLVKFAAPASALYAPSMVVSPDGKRLALFMPESDKAFYGPMRLHVVDLGTGEPTKLPFSVRYVPPATDSFIGHGPPLAWLDPTRILFVRTETPVAQSGSVAVFPAGGTVNQVAVADVVTGQFRDVAPVPGDAHMTRVALLPPAPGVPPVVETVGGPMALPGRGGARLAVDVDGSRLVECDVVGPDLYVRRAGQVCRIEHRGRMLDEMAGNVRVAVSPDGRHAAWLSGAPAREVRCCDTQSGAVAVVARGWFAEPICWIVEGGLAPRPALDPLPPGWSAFEHAPYPEPRPPDTRPDVTTLLDFALACDKPAYRLHDPVRLTLTVTNRSNRDVQVARPRPEWRLVALTMKHPGGSRLIDRYWGSDAINPVESVTLKPGGSLAHTEVLEVAQPGRYTLDAEYNTHGGGLKLPVDVRGRLHASAVTFTVETSPDERKALGEKVVRILAALRAQHARGPDWDGWLPAVDDLAAVGEEAGPFLTAALRAERDPGLVTRLFWALNGVAGVQALSFYQDAFAGGDEETQKLAVAGLAEMYAREAGARQAALQLLLAGLGAKLPEGVRTAAADRLARIKRPEVRDAFSRAIQSGDAAVTPRAARALTAWEGLDLAEWLVLVAKEPTQARLAAARVITDDLRVTWHIDHGDLNGLAWEDVAAGGAALGRYRGVLQAWEKWAREHPNASATYFDADREGW